MLDELVSVEVLVPTGSGSAPMNFHHGKTLCQISQYSSSNPPRVLQDRPTVILCVRLVEYIYSGCHLQLGFRCYRLKRLPRMPEASRTVLVTRLPVDTAIVRDRLHIPKPELTQVVSIESGAIESETGKLSFGLSLAHLLHLIVLEMLLMRWINVSEGGGWTSWGGSVLEDCNGRH